MPLIAGTRFGAYEILGAIGAGGMGEVYRARDTKLGRDVAIKILPEAFAHDPERVARFQREAQMLASLNHPHIAQIYGLEGQVGQAAQVGQAGQAERSPSFIVMELVEGESLAEKLASGSGPWALGSRRAESPKPQAQSLTTGAAGRQSLGVPDALSIARQIVDALEAAHEKGIIHRDLKPANVMLTSDGQVKVLDFGLAKALDPGPDDPAHAAATHSPTITFGATQAGVILGTAAYMSPEQAKGRAADKRSDVWGFGCVFYEMLTGRRAFEGEDISDTLAAILRAEPDWTALPRDLPLHIQAALKRCLVKDRKTRIADISTVRFVMDEGASLAPLVLAIDAAGGRAKPSSGSRLWQALAATLTLTTIAGFAVWYLGRPPAPAMSRFFVSPPENGQFVAGTRTAASVAISPDGRMLTFTARETGGKTLLWVRPIDSLVARPLAGTDNAAYPFWSPDSLFIAYSVPGKLMKISVGGGPAQTLCAFTGDAMTTGRGGSWNRDGIIVFNDGPGPLHRVSSGGGDSSPVTQAETGQPRSYSHNFPSFLPDGHHVLFYSAASEVGSAVYVTSLDTGESKRLMEASSGAIYSAATGHLLFVREGTLLAQSFDPRKLELANDPFPIAENVESETVPGLMSFSTSAGGILAYGVGGSANNPLQMVWIDRQGKQIETFGPPGNYRGLDLSPDGRRVAAHRHDGTGGNIWVSESSGRTTQLTFNAAQENSSPVWSPDGMTIAYGSFRTGKRGLYRRPSNNSGNEEQLMESDDQQDLPMSWSPDGQFIVYQALGLLTNANQEWLLPLAGDRKPRRLLQGPFQQSHGQVSPDGKWLAYYSNETGRSELCVQPFPSGAKMQITTDGGTFPRWRRDGRELFYMTMASLGKMMSVDVKASGNTLEYGAPKELFDTGYVNLPHVGGGPYHTYAVSPDGQRFLIPRPVSNVAATARPIVVVTNWAAGFRK